MSIQEEKQKVLIEKLLHLIFLYKGGHLGGEIMPEDCLLGKVEKFHLLNVLTLGMSLNYQRNSYKLWEAILTTYQDEKLRWIFDPIIVSSTDESIIQKTLLNHKIALQPNKHPEIWKRNAKGLTFNNTFNDVDSFLKSVEYDIEDLIRIMQYDRKKEFPYLSGPKIFNYWLYTLETYGNITWKNRELITIAPDTHILKASVKLNIVDKSVLRGTKKDRDLVSNTWKEILSNTDISPIDVHTPLWLWSRMNFPSL